MRKEVFSLEKLANFLADQRGKTVRIKEHSQGLFEVVGETSSYTDTLWIEIECKEDIRETVRKYKTAYTVMLKYISTHFKNLIVYHDTVDIGMTVFDRNLLTKGVALILNSPSLEIRKFRVDGKDVEKQLRKLREKHLLLAYVEEEDHFTYWGVEKKAFKKAQIRKVKQTFVCVEV